MAAYTFGEAVVLVQVTGDLAIGATGVLRATEGGDPVPIFDLNDSPIPSVLVGPKGTHHPFKADIEWGVLDFGSAQLVAESIEFRRAGAEVRELAESAVSQVSTLQVSKAPIIHTHPAADITDFTAAVQAVPGFGDGGGGTGFIDGGTPTSTPSDIEIDGGIIL